MDSRFEGRRRLQRRRKRQMQHMAIQEQGVNAQLQASPNTSQSYREYALKHSARSQRSARSRLSSRGSSRSQVKVPRLPPLENFSRSPSARSLRSSHSMQSIDSSATLGQFTQLLHAQNAKLENDLVLQQRERGGFIGESGAPRQGSNTASQSG